MVKKVILFCLVFAFKTHATVHKVPEDFGKIQDAINFSRDGDVVVLSPKVYSEAIDFKNKKISIKSDGSRSVDRYRITDFANHVEIVQNMSVGAQISGVMFSSANAGCVSLAGGEVLGCAFDKCRQTVIKGYGIVKNCKVTGYASPWSQPVLWCQQNKSMVLAGCVFDDSSDCIVKGGAGSYEFFNCVFNKINGDPGRGYSILQFSSDGYEYIVQNCTFIIDRPVNSSGPFNAITAEGSVVKVQNNIFYRSKTDFVPNRDDQPKG